MGFESHTQPASERSSNPEDAPLMRNIHGKLQAVIALKYFQDSHRDEVAIDAYHPENNSSEIRGTAIREFIANGYAARFGDYREAHLDDPVHLDDEAELNDIYKAVVGETIH